MPHTSVVPDSEIIGSPLEADLRIVVLGDNIEEIAQQQIGFVFCYAVDALGEAFVHIHALPSSYG
jgi:hypothetical protein